MPQTNAADAERLALAEAWIAQDPDPETRAELAALVEGARTGDARAADELAAQARRAEGETRAETVGEVGRRRVVARSGPRDEAG